MVFLTFSIINFVNFIITPKASKLIEYVRGADEDFTLPRISYKSIAKEILRSKTTHPQKCFKFKKRVWKK